MNDTKVMKLLLVKYWFCESQISHCSLVRDGWIAETFEDLTYQLILQTCIVQSLFG